jgi:hypothetical protein
MQTGRVPERTEPGRGTEMETEMGRETEIAAETPMDAAWCGALEMQWWHRAAHGAHCAVPGGTTATTTPSHCDSARTGCGRFVTSSSFSIFNVNWMAAV